MGAHLLSDNLRPVLLPYGDVWRKGRKVAQTFTSTTVAPSYEPIQALESLYCIRDLLHSPKDYERLFDRYAASVILRLTYGQKVETGEEDVVKRIVTVNHNLERIVSPGSYLVDTFPSLNRLPGFVAPWKREGRRLHEEELDLFMSQLRSVKCSMDAGTVEPCFAKSWWEMREKSGLTDPQAAYVMGTLFEAGAGTSKAALCSFLLALVHHPPWLARMHAEVDAVVGPDRLPQFSDLPSLPVTRACMKETLRWRPVTSGGLPHQLTRDDEYNGFHIPAGANIHPNQWAIHRDAALYPDPETYNPARWLESEWPTYRTPLTVYPNIQSYSNFGFGRRICVGQNIAERNLMIIAARIAWAADIGAVKPDKLPPLYDYRAGFNSFPKWFALRCEPRSRERMEVIEREYRLAKEKDRGTATQVNR